MSYKCLYKPFEELKAFETVFKTFQKLLRHLKKLLKRSKRPQSLKNKLKMFLKICAVPSTSVQQTLKIFEKAPKPS